MASLAHAYDRRVVLLIVGCLCVVVASSTAATPSTIAIYHYDRVAPNAQSTRTSAPAASGLIATLTSKDPAGRSANARLGGFLAAKAGEILPKPLVSDAKLQNYVNDLYKGTTNANRVGTGTTTDAVREEVATGQATAGKFHIQKAEDTARNLGNWLRRNPGADPHDRLVAQSLRDELLDALGGGR